MQCANAAFNDLRLPLSRQHYGLLNQLITKKKPDGVRNFFVSIGCCLSSHWTACEWNRRNCLANREEKDDNPALTDCSSTLLGVCHHLRWLFLHVNTQTSWIGQSVCQITTTIFLLFVSSAWYLKGVFDAVSRLAYPHRLQHTSVPQLPQH